MIPAKENSCKQGIAELHSATLPPLRRWITIAHRAVADDRHDRDRADRARQDAVTHTRETAETFADCMTKTVITSHCSVLSHTPQYPTAYIVGAYVRLL